MSRRKGRISQKIRHLIKFTKKSSFSKVSGWLQDLFLLALTSHLSKSICHSKLDLKIYKNSRWILKHVATGETYLFLILLILFMECLWILCSTPHVSDLFKLHRHSYIGWSWMPTYSSRVFYMMYKHKNLFYAVSCELNLFFRQLQTYIFLNFCGSAKTVLLVYQV